MCTHDRYRKYPYMQLGKAWAALKRNEICHLGEFITTCEDCGADLSEFNIRKVATVEDYIK